MKKFLLGYCIVFSVFAFGQKRCDCSQKDAFIKRRDYDAITDYKAENLQKESSLLMQTKVAACRAYAFHLRAVDALEKEDFEAAGAYLKQEKSVLDSLRCPAANYLEYTVSSADLQLRIGKYDNAISLYNRALGLLKRSENKNLQTRILLSLSSAMSKLGKEDKARGYIAMAHPVSVILPDGRSKVENLYNLSYRYYHQYQATGKAELLDSAQHIATFGIRLARTIGYTEGFIRGYNLLEDKEYHERNYRQALVYLDSALYFAQPGIHLEERNGIYADMADIYLELKQYDKAYVCADSSLSYAIKLDNPYKIRDGLELLYNCAKLSGEYERALIVYEELVRQRENVLKLETKKAYGELEEKYHRVRREKSQSEYEQDKKLLEQQRQIGNLRSKLITVGIIITALLACYIFIVFRQKNIRTRQERLEMEQRLQRARINPDFIYNALTNLQGAASENNADVAKKLAIFTKLIKQSLDSSHDDFLTLDKEIELLTSYMELQRDRLKKGFTFAVEVDEQIDQTNVCLPTMLLQPFVENSIERGFRDIAYEGRIELRFEQQNNELRIRILDNGKGLKAGTSTRASEIINDRLYIVNKINKDSASYLIRERDSGGVSVEIYLPLITCEMAEARKKEL